MRVGVKDCFAALVVCVFLLGCQDKTTSEKEAEKPRVFEDELVLADVYPMANGTAYLKSFGQIYFINGNIAEEVVGLPSNGFGDLTGLSDGSALYLSPFSDPPGLFRLRGARATPVVEGNSSEQQIADVKPYGFFFAENQRLKREIEKCADMSDAEMEDTFWK